MKLTPQPWSWKAPPPDVSWLESRGVPAPMVWLARATDDSPPEPELLAMLSGAERDRLQRFRVPADRRRFLIGRGVLRKFLAVVMNVRPEHVELGYGPNDKPFLAGNDHGKEIRFNLSHSGDLVLVGFHPTREMGVDVEQIRPGPDYLEIARRFFAPDDCRAVESASPEALPAIFFRAWTRHEARLKALGTGFFAEPATIPNAKLTCLDLELPPGYLGAVAWMH